MARQDLRPPDGGAGEDAHRIQLLTKITTAFTNPPDHLLFLPDSPVGFFRVLTKGTKAESDPRLVVGLSEKIAGQQVSTILRPTRENGVPEIKRELFTFTTSRHPHTSITSRHPHTSRPLTDDELAVLDRFLTNPEDHSLIDPIVRPTPLEIGTISAKATRRSIGANS
ncbi:MAG TPA: hypothetical protein VLG67_00540 [Candidatus Saccharimonadales bacterium]|nr:hypothetical protein [Candidatus Saccharimonadales bacterium]